MTEAITRVIFFDLCTRKVGLSHEGPCHQACVCLHIYQPVCGVDGKTYSNACQMDCRSVCFVCGLDLTNTISENKI